MGSSIKWVLTLSIKWQRGMRLLRIKQSRRLWIWRGSGGSKRVSLCEPSGSPRISHRRVWNFSMSPMSVSIAPLLSLPQSYSNPRNGNGQRQCIILLKYVVLSSSCKADEQLEQRNHDVFGVRLGPLVDLLLVLLMWQLTSFFLRRVKRRILETFPFRSLMRSTIYPSRW